MVDDDPDGDNSSVLLHADKMEELGFNSGDTVFLVGKRRHTTVAVVNESADIEISKIKMNRVLRNNLRVRTTDTIIVKFAPDVPNLEMIEIRAFKDTVEGLTGDLTATY